MTFAVEMNRLGGTWTISKRDEYDMLLFSLFKSLSFGCLTAMGSRDCYISEMVDIGLVELHQIVSRMLLKH
jgi:hypothetical protein